MKRNNIKLYDEEKEEEKKTLKNPRFILQSSNPIQSRIGIFCIIFLQFAFMLL